MTARRSITQPGSESASRGWGRGDNGPLGEGEGLGAVPGGPEQPLPWATCTAAPAAGARKLPARRHPVPEPRLRPTPTSDARLSLPSRPRHCHSPGGRAGNGTEWQLRTFPDRPFQTPLRLLWKRRCRHHPNPRQLGWGVREERSGAPWEFPRLRCPPPRPHSRPAGQGPQGHDHEQEGTSTAGSGLASSAHSVTAAPHRAAGGAGAGGAAVRTPGQAPAALALPPQQPRGPVPSGSSTAFL